DVGVGRVVEVAVDVVGERGDRHRLEGAGVGDDQVVGEGATRLGQGERRRLLDDLDLRRDAGDGDHRVVGVGDDDAGRVGGRHRDDVGLAGTGVAGEGPGEGAGVRVAGAGAGLQDGAHGGGARALGGDVAVDVVGERRDGEDF